MSDSENARARRAAKHVGLKAIRSRRRLSVDNLGGLQLIDPEDNYVVAGSRFELSPEDVIDRCRSQ